MAVIRPFKALRPTKETAARVAALPYDVYNTEEAREVVKGEPMSFLGIDRAETAFPEGQDLYAPEVYTKADEMLRQAEADGIMQQDEKACYYLYELTMDGRVQTGLVACSSVDDYLNGVIRKHENTLEAKEQDRIRHVDTCSAQTGPIFLAYRAQDAIREIVQNIRENQEAEQDFTSDDSIRHRVFLISDDAQIAAISDAFANVACTYIADGHHRAASAVKVSLMRRAEHPDYTGEEEFNYFLSVLFPDEELKIMDYNRVLMDLSGLTQNEMLEKLCEKCFLEMAPEAPYHPEQKGEMGFLMDGQWYRLKARPEYVKEDPVGALDVSFLQREILTPVWKIDDPRTDSRIDFVGGIRGLEELERRCENGCAAAFAMYPTSIEELLEVADASLLMPPKSTWFEPKLRSGLFIHKIER
ncbi:MAG: DUF1015 domain-containing protein [Eubacterium sp.]|nr:DUF1015 domain-containing protein [Eubacterium sp.]